MRPIRYKLLAICAIAGLVSLAASQELHIESEASLLGNGPLDEGRSFTFSKRVDEVNLVFTVTDRKGHLINDLTAADLRLLDNKKAPEKLRFFQRQSELPLRVALLIDTSGSVHARLAFEKQGAKVFLKKMLRPELDQAFVASFDKEVHLLHDFTNDVNALAKSFDKVKAGGQTVLFDSLIFAAHKLQEKDKTEICRRVIVVISDGDDNRSKAIQYDAEQAAMAADAVIFALSTNNLQGTYPAGEATLELLTRSTGGGILAAHQEGQFNKAFAQLEKALRSQYALGYTPPDFQADGSFHSVEIRSRKAGLKVQCRRGYFAAKQ